MSYASMKVQKILNKSTNILEFIGILQFSETHLIFEIIITENLKKWLPVTLMKL